MKRLVIFVITLMLLLSCSAGLRKGPSTDIGPAPLLSFVFDDGNETDYLIAREIFKTQGAPASFAVVTGWINTKNYLSLSHLRQLQDDGFEIMSHTVSHPNLTSLNAEKIASELSESKATLEGWGLRVDNLVYPYNKNNALVREVAAQYYRSARGGRSMLNPAVPERYELKSYAFSHNRNTDRMKTLIDRAAAERKWLILYLHNIDMKVKVSRGDGTFRAGEDLRFSPSGAMGRYSTELFDWFYFLPLKGRPQAGDTISGQSSGASCRLDEILYNDKEALTALIEYARVRYPDMKIVTIDKGLDIYGVK